MSEIFLELTIVIFLAAVLSYFFRRVGQPVVLAYILAGVFIGPFAGLQLQQKEILHTLGQLGVTLLLFMVGLEMPIQTIRRIGWVTILAGLSQVIVTATLAFFLGVVLHLSALTSFILAIALTFSSTILIVEQLHEKKEHHSLFGRLLVGILLLQDCFALALFILLPGFSNTVAFSNFDIGLLLVKVVGLIVALLILGKWVFPRLLDSVASSSDTLFLVAIAWLLGFSTLMSSPFFGFSLEMGGFVAGITLAAAMERYQIGAHARPLRDFFLTIFFVFLGMNLKPFNLAVYIVPLLAFFAFVIFVKPLILAYIMSVFGYRKRTAFLTGVYTGQISEFSLILIGLALQRGYISTELVSVVSFVGVLSFALSTFAMHNAQKLFGAMGSLLLLERKHTNTESLEGEEKKLAELSGHTVLIGGHRMGERILQELAKRGDALVIIDFDPDIIRDMRGKNMITVFGDIADEEIHNRSRLDLAKLVVSTVPDVHANLTLLHALRRKNTGVTVIVVAKDTNDAKLLYAHGADYVVLPDLSAGRYVVWMLTDQKNNFETRRLEDMQYL